MKINPPKDEQEICVSCGFCCDNTLFEYASLEEGETVEGHFLETKFKIEGSHYFKLPCPHFEGKCTIYDQDKPAICGKFKCKLLKSFEACEIEKGKALEIIENAIALRKEIFDLYASSVSEKTVAFREIMTIVNKERKEKSKEVTILQAKTNLFSLLLIRYFKSKESFDELLTLND